MTEPTLTEKAAREVRVIIKSGAAVSAPFDVDVGLALCSITVPVNWTYAHLSFQSDVDGKFFDIADFTGSPITLECWGGRTIACDPPIAFGYPKIRLLSGRSVSPTNQAFDRELILWFRPPAR